MLAIKKSSIFRESLGCHLQIWVYSSIALRYRRMSVCRTKQGGEPSILTGRTTSARIVTGNRSSSILLLCQRLTTRMFCKLSNRNSSELSEKFRTEWERSAGWLRDVCVRTRVQGWSPRCLIPLTVSTSQIIRIAGEQRIAGTSRGHQSTGEWNVSLQFINWDQRAGAAGARTRASDSDACSLL